MKRYAFIKTKTANKITLASGYRFVKGTSGKYKIMKKEVVAGGATCKCKGSAGSCTLTASGGTGICTNSGCTKGCRITIEQP